MAQRGRLHSSFIADFQGDAIAQFQNVLIKYDKEYKSSRYNGRTIAIAQSNGTGKSKLMHELTKTVICLLAITLGTNMY
jgi:ATPase subunit of ABC transporter with duplicated ATPase domains